VDLSGLDPEISREKAIEEEVDRQRAEIAARAIAEGSPILKKSGRSRSGVESGIETPDRFVGGHHPHPPRVSPRHVQFQSPGISSASSPTTDHDLALRGERGARDEIHSPRGMNGSRNRIPRDRDFESEVLRTPTSSVQGRRRRSRERGAHLEYDGDTHPRRAFAVWGQDESDSATSDSDL
jgi:NAD+ kinase